MDATRRTLGKAMLALSAAHYGGLARAQPQTQGDYPTRPIRLIDPFAPGAGTDQMARLVAQKVTEDWGTAMIVENHGGGGGSVGLGLAAMAAPDGYTLTILTSSHTVNVTLLGAKQPYNLTTDLAPITQLVTQPYVLVLNPKVPVNSVAELIAYAKQRASSPLTYGSAGQGSTGHLAGALFSQMSGAPFTHIPYRGAGPAMVDIISGQIDMIFATQFGVMQFIQAGKLHGLAVTGLKRAAALPDTPTVAESGLPGYQMGSWYGIAAPGRTPPSIVAKLNKEIVHVLQTPDVVQKITAEGSEPVGSSPEQFSEHIKSEVERWQKLIHDAAIPVQTV